MASWRVGLVSVIVLCYNQARFVVETLDSVKNQTYPHVQLIVMDDCSTDGSVDVIRGWAAARAVGLELVAHSANRGVCATLNQALTLASGEYVAVVAADDCWLPDKLQRQVDAFRAAPAGTAVVYSDAFVADVDGQRLPGNFVERWRQFATLPAGDLFEVLLGGNFIPALTPLIRREALDAVGVYDEQLSFEDWDMWLRLAARFRFATLSEPTGIYRLVPASLTQRLFVDGGTDDRRLLDRFRILYKCRLVTRLSEAAKRHVDSELMLLAEQLYRRGAAHRGPSLWRASRLRPSARWWLMWAMSAMRLPYSWFRRLDALHTTLVDEWRTDDATHRRW